MFKVILNFIEKHTLIPESRLRNYFSNTFWLMIERVMRVCVGFFIGIYTIKYLGSDQFGMYSYVLSFISFFSAFSTLGLDGILVKALVREPEKKEVYLATAIHLKIWGAFLAISLIICLLFVLPHDKSLDFLICIASLTFLFQSFNILDSFFQSKIISKQVVIVQLCQIFLSALFKFLMILFQAPLIFFVIALVLDSFVLAVGLFMVFRKHITRNSQSNYNGKIAGDLLKSSLPLFLSEIMVALYMRFDQVIIKFYLGDKLLGYYAVAVMLSEAFYFIPVIALRIFFPVLLALKNKEENMDLYYKNLQRLYSVLAFIAFIIAFLLSVMADKIIMFLFGHEYKDVIPVLRIYAWGNVFVFLGVATERWLWTENLQRYSFYRTLGGSIISIFLNILLVPLFGITGAAIATLVSFSFVVIISFIIFKPLRTHLRFILRSFDFIGLLKQIIFKWK